jgi:hypothetical protein
VDCGPLTVIAVTGGGGGASAAKHLFSATLAALISAVNLFSCPRAAFCAAARSGAGVSANSFSKAALLV